LTRRSHRIAKHKFEAMCPGALFNETTRGPHDHEK
jgi:hypothetical protein